MNKIFIATSIFIGYLNYGLSGQDQNSWSFELRRSLTLDRPILSDSIIEFNPKNGINSKKTIYINKIRPDFSKAYKILDSIRTSLDDDKDLGRLITIGLEYETRYMAEFQFSNEYYLDIYHKTIDLIPYHHTELNFLYELENTILFIKHKSINKDTLLNILLGENNSIYNKNMYVTNLWKRYGGLTFSPFESILEFWYNEIYDDIEERIIKLDITKKENKIKFYSLLNMIKSQDNLCKVLNSKDYLNASSGILHYFENVVLPKNKSECVQKFINKLKNLERK